MAQITLVAMPALAEAVARVELEFMTAMKRASSTMTAAMHMSTATTDHRYRLAGCKSLQRQRQLLGCFEG